jgi:serine/threonine protein phosphatase 1
MINRFPKNDAGRDFAVGDIHGCFQLLEEKLIEIGFDESRDRLFSVGDLVDRGPESERTLEWLQKPFFHAVRGNHEQMAIDYMEGFSDPELYGYNGGAWFMELPQDEQRNFYDAFNQLPFAIEVAAPCGLIGLVHAESPVNDWADLEAAYTGHNAATYQQISIWNRDRIRQANPSNVDGVTLVICGHTPLEFPIRLGNHFFIDTGAVYGRTLTIIDLSEVEA